MDSGTIGPRVVGVRTTPALSRLLSLAPGALLVLVLACGAKPGGPPPIRYGEEPCAHCGMLISQARFAAALEWPDGGAVKFDDIGCLVAAVRRTAAPPPWLFAHDFDEERWIDARRAFFVRAPALETPMGSGLVAFDRREAAERFAATVRGELVTWADLAAGALEDQPTERRRER